MGVFIAENRPRKAIAFRGLCFVPKPDHREDIYHNRRKKT